MKTSVEYGLQGQFKVDIYNQSGDLIDTTDYFSNFITPTGLSYPYTYNFADCFRFLTLGVGTSANTMATTGIEITSVIPAKDVTTNLVKYQTLSYLHDPHLDKKSDASAGSCGTRVGADGPAMYRGWVIPTGDDNYMGATVAVNEFMVSPQSGENPTGRYAFSRVQRSVTLPSGTKTIVTYMLNVKIQNTGIKYFESGTFNTGQAEVSEQEHLVESFGSLSGYYRQVYHGIRCVDNQGRTFIPKYGDPMEPSNVRLDQLAIYFSPDNSQFEANEKGGAALTTEAAYRTDGLYALSFNHELDVNANVPDDKIYNNAKLTISNEPQNDSTSPFKLIRDIRLKPSSSSERPPRLSDYTNTTTQSVDLKTANYDYLIDGTDGVTAVSMATFGEEQLRPNEFDKGFISSFSSMMSNLGVVANDLTGRKRKLTRKGFITPINALGHNTRFGSLVYAFRNGSYYYPAVDCLFYDSSGRSVMQHYRKFSGVVFQDRGKSIIDATLTTSPRTYGGFHVRSVQGPIVFPLSEDNQISAITGHSGFYSDTTVEIDMGGWTQTQVVPSLARRAYDTAPFDGYAGEQMLTHPCSNSLAIYNTQEACEGAGHTWSPLVVPGYTGEDGLGGGQGMVSVGGASYYGVGAIQGYLTPALDYGIVDHHLDAVTPANSVLTPPTSLSKMYWPYVDKLGGQEIKFATEGLKYFHTGMGIVPDSNAYFQNTTTSTCSDGTSATEALCCTENAGTWANSTCTDGEATWDAHGQVVADLTFNPNTPLVSCVDDPNNLTAGVNLPLSSITQNRWSITCQGGFFLTKATGDGTNGDYDGDWLEGSSPATQTNALLANVVPTGYLTGYLIPVSEKSNICNTTWTGSKTDWDNLTTKVEFPVNVSQYEVYFGPQSSSYLTKTATVSEFFDGFGDDTVRGSNMVSRLSGKALGVSDGDQYLPVFTGFNEDYCSDAQHTTQTTCEAPKSCSDGTSATEALCCTENGGSWANDACDGSSSATWANTNTWGTTDGLYLIGAEFNFNNAAYDVKPTAQLAGQIEMSDFIPPRGTFTHYESQRLLPNFATGQPLSDAYPREAIKQGGVSPGMSSLNTMEVYLDITWSAPCGDVSNLNGECIEQPA